MTFLRSRAITSRFLVASQPCPNVICVGKTRRKKSVFVLEQRRDWSRDAESSTNIARSPAFERGVKCRTKSIESDEDEIENSSSNQLCRIDGTHGQFRFLSNFISGR